MRVVEAAIELVGREPDLEKRRLRLRNRLDRARGPDRRHLKDPLQTLPFPDPVGGPLDDGGVVGLAGLLPRPLDPLGHRVR